MIKQNMQRINSAEDMIKFGQNINGNKILLYGDLGAGKTHFTKGFAKKLGIDSNQVQSPTYSYINIYDEKLLHIDMYRLEDINELIEKGILDEIINYEYIIIEWPKFEENYIDQDWTKLQINKIDENTREILYL